jgi:hypothetical protein
MVNQGESVGSTGFHPNNSETCLHLSPYSLAWARQDPWGSTSTFARKMPLKAYKQRRHGDADHKSAPLLAPRKTSEVSTGSVDPSAEPLVGWLDWTRNVCKVITPSAYTMSASGGVRRQASILKCCWTPVMPLSTSMRLDLFEVGIIENVYRFKDM